MLALLSTAALFGAAPDAAKPADSAPREVPLGSRLARRVETNDWDDRKIRMVQVKFGECVIKKHGEVAQHFVLTPDMEKAQWRKDVGRIADGFCLLAASDEFGSEMKFPADTMRYALADALVRREFSTGPLPSIKDAAPLVQPQLDEAEYRPEWGEKVKPAKLKELADARTQRLGVIYLAHFGECVARADPVGTHALLMTRPDTTEESAAFRALNPMLGQCLTAGQSLTFSKPTLRGTLAMNYYRLAHAPRATAPAGATN
jgi:hypothetical protein